ncbi:MULTISPECIES: phosphoadenylyl-sulfate reductase [Pasteurellaceae]|uniref:phosphoadenylyl-sulfate reductase n=1 Tax=Pasteurellaceae TaxID=712 RepID=UPI003568207E
MMIIKPNLWQIPQPSAAVFAQTEEKARILIERLQLIAERHRDARFASSLAVEDMVITDAIVNAAVPLSVFTLETGRLNPETLALAEAVSARYPSLDFSLFRPNPEKVRQYEQEKGRNAFYDSVALRRECCFIRKIEPLNRALQGADAWLTGQRREQSVTRSELPFHEQDSARGIDKYNPIFDWSEAEVWAYILSHRIPYNALYEQGYPSIGCEPCTRPIKQDEDIRAGRWWWENKDSKECGLHK